MGLDVTLYGYAVNLNDLASYSSSGCGIYDIWIWGFVFGSRLNYRSLSIHAKKNKKSERIWIIKKLWLEVNVVVVKVKAITHTINEF